MVSKPSLNLDRNTVVLVVDDDPVALILAEASLTSQSMDVVIANSGENALALMERVNPDIVLLDIMMPGIDGFATCSAIRKLPAHKNTPIIMLTGRDDIDAVERAFDAGTWDFASKPVNWTLLRHRIAHSLAASIAFSVQRKAARISNTLDNSSNEIIAFDTRNFQIEHANASARKNLGHKDTALYALCLRDITNGVDAADLERRMARLKSGQQLTVKLQLKRADGATYPVEGTMLHNDEEQPPVYVGIFQDITERRRTENELRRLAYYDDLTGLPNRTLFKEYVNKALAIAARNYESFAICILDLDGFKSINDALGHSFGDLLLKQVSDRLTSQIRQHDAVVRLNGDAENEEATLEVARFGGDEFLILLTNFCDASAPAMAVNRILRSIAIPYNVQGQELSVTGSVGIALYPQDGNNLDELLRRADSAMYVAKNSGKNKYYYYCETNGKNPMERIKLEAELRKAIEHDELELYYQPQVEGKTGKLIGLEALLRWNHPRKGFLSPYEFIPIAEETGLIIPIGRWVLQSATNQLDDWVDLFGPELKLGVNVSGIQLRQDEFFDVARNVIANRRTQQGTVVLELTESAIMTTTQDKVGWLRELKEMGAEIAVDDFGTGYSSLSYLKELPLDYLKIDRSFIIDMTKDSDDLVIVNMIFKMAQALGLKVVVEGVETEEQCEFVNEMGDCVIQGYLFGRPVSAKEIEASYKHVSSTKTSYAQV
jgi:diguanylate cyclase (GGDEF)-like protein/PAS domain S-box-containing protein